MIKMVRLPIGVCSGWRSGGKGDANVGCGGPLQWDDTSKCGQKISQSVCMKFCCSPFASALNNIWEKHNKEVKDQVAHGEHGGECELVDVF